jgi:hypothetical protein
MSHVKINPTYFILNKINLSSFWHMLQIHITFACMLAPLNLLPSMKQQNRKQHENKTQNLMQGQ